jgi:hypothetical protein
MRRPPPTLVIDGKRYRWPDILALRRQQVAAARRTEQLTLFATLPEDSRPRHERTTADRYRQPSLFTQLED